MISYSDQNSPGATVIEPAPLAVLPMKKTDGLIKQNAERAMQHQTLPLQLSGIKSGETIQHGESLTLSARDKTAKTEILLDGKTERERTV